MERKICKDCKHYYSITELTPQGSDFCRRVKDIITGRDTPCRYVRYDQESCGIEARFFEQKAETPKSAKKKSLIDILLRSKRK